MELAKGTLIFSALSEEPCQIKLQQAVSKILIICSAISVCTFSNRKISQPSLRHFPSPYHASRLFWLFYNKGVHFGSCWFQVFTSSYYLLFLFGWCFSLEKVKVICMFLQDLFCPLPSPGLTHGCWDQEVTKGFAAAEHWAESPLQSYVLYSGKC